MSDPIQFDKRFYFEPEDQDSILFQKLYLSAFDINSFNEKKKAFELFDISNSNDDSVRQEIRKVMTFKHHITGQNYYNIPTWTYTFNRGTKFQRIIKIGKSDLVNPPVNKIKNCTDVWNPPIDKVTKYGRLNYPYESLLYTAYNNQEICIAEMKITDNDRFALITYEAIQDINTTIVGHYQDSTAYTSEENLKNHELTNFFYNEFTKEVKTGDENQYKVSSNIIKECYTLSNESQDGWVYPSIAMKKGYNVCFKPENAKKKLALKGVEICKFDNRYEFVVNYVTETINESGDLLYHLIGSDKQKELYPHIVLYG